MPMTEALQFLLLVFAGWVNRKALGQKAKAVGRRALRELGCLVSPDTLLRWHRQRVAKKHDGSTRRGPAKRGIKADVEQLIVRMALDNGSWGYTRIQGP